MTSDCRLDSQMMLLSHLLSIPLSLMLARHLSQATNGSEHNHSKVASAPRLIGDPVHFALRVCFGLGVALTSRPLALRPCDPPNVDVGDCVSPALVGVRQLDVDVVLHDFAVAHHAGAMQHIDPGDVVVRF